MSNQKNVLNAETRAKTGTIPSRQARRAGRIPAVIYGHGAEVRHVTVDKKEWNVIKKQDIHILTITIDEKDEVNVLIKSSDYDYLKGEPIHVDFQAVNMDEKIAAMIPVHGIGTPIGLSQGGVMEQAIHELKVLCTPTSLPEVLEVNISNIGLNDIIHIGDIELPEGVEIAGDTSLPVFHVAEPNTDNSEDDETTEE